MKRILIRTAVIFLAVIMAAGSIPPAARAEETVHLSGDIKTSNLPAYCSVVMTGDTNVIVDADRTITSISGEGLLTITGGSDKTLTIRSEGDGIYGNEIGVLANANLDIIAENGYGISVNSVRIEGGRVNIRCKHTGIHAASGAITVEGGVVSITGDFHEGMRASSEGIGLYGGNIYIAGERGKGYGIFAQKRVYVYASLNISGTAYGIVTVWDTVIEGRVNINVSNLGIWSIDEDVFFISGETSVAAGMQAVKTEECTVKPEVAIALPEGGRVSEDLTTIVDQRGSAAKEVRICAPVTGAAYTLAGISAKAGGVKEDGKFFLPKDYVTTPIWKNGNAPSSDRYYAGPNRLYKDRECTEILTKAPVPGTAYYVYFTVFNMAAETGNFDYSKLGINDCTLEMEGYNTKCVRTVAYPNGCNAVFMVTPKPRFSLTGLTVYALEMINASGWMVAPISDATCTCEGGETPAEWCFSINSGYVYSDYGLGKGMHSEPGPGDSGYMEVTVESKYDDHSLDFTRLRNKDCTLEMPGYSAECVWMTTYADGESGRDAVRLIFRLTRTPAADYIATECAVTAERIIRSESGGWWPDGESASFTWSGKTPSESYYKCVGAALFKDKAMTQVLGTAPAPGNTYYVRYIVSQTDDIPGDAWIDFSYLKDRKCTLDIPGYTTECVNVKRDTDLAGDVYAIITFSLSVFVPDHELAGLSASASGVVRDSDYRYRMSGLQTEVSWKDNKAPADTACRGGWSPLYTDSACTDELKADPVPLYSSYYVKYTIFNTEAGDKSIRFSKARLSDCGLALEGWDTKCTRVTAIEDPEHKGCLGAELVFWLVKLAPVRLDFNYTPDQSIWALRDEGCTISWELNMEPDKVILQTMKYGEWTDGPVLTGLSEYDLTYDPAQTSERGFTPCRLVATKGTEMTFCTFTVNWKDVYTLAGFEVTADGVAGDDRYFLSRSRYSLLWEEENTFSRFSGNAGSTVLCADEECTEPLDHAPETGETCYVKYTGAMDYPEYVFRFGDDYYSSLEVDGYETGIAMQRKIPRSDGIYLTVVFRLTKLEEEADETVAYPVWVEGVQVDENNMDNVLGDDYTCHSVVFTPASGSAPARLTLNNASIDGGLKLYGNTYAGIYSEGMDLDIYISNINKILPTTIMDQLRLEFTGIWVKDGELTVIGNGALDVLAGMAPEDSGVSTAIRAGSMTVGGGTVTARGRAGHSSAGVHVDSSLTVNGGDLIARGGDAENSRGVICGSMTVNGGTAEALGNTLAIGKAPDMRNYTNPYVTVNSAASPDGAREWNGSDALGGAGSAFRYVKMESGNLRYPKADAELPYGTVGVDYWGRVGVVSGTGTYPYTFSIDGLPDGMEYDEAYHNIYGIPTAAGSFSVTVTVTDDKGLSDSRTFELVITPEDGSFTVKYDTLGGPSVKSAKVEAGKPAPMPPSPVRAGYALVAWFADKACTEMFEFGKPVTDNVTVYAKWRATASVTGEISGNKLSYKVTGAPEGAKLAAARYDGGKMTDIRVISPVPAQGSAVLNGSGKGYKLILMDSTNHPLCPAWEASAP